MSQVPQVPQIPQVSQVSQVPRVPQVPQGTFAAIRALCLGNRGLRVARTPNPRIGFQCPEPNCPPIRVDSPQAPGLEEEEEEEEREEKGEQ